MGNKNSRDDGTEKIHLTGEQRKVTSWQSALSTTQSFDAEEFFSFLQSLPRDKKLKRIFELSKRLIKQKPELVRKVRETEASLKLHHRNVTISKIVASSVGIVSGACFITGIALAPVTFGASLGLTIGGGVASSLGGATFVGADIVENKLIKQGLDKIQSELSEFHKELQVLAKFDHHGLLADKVKRFGGTLVELENLSEVGFIAFLEKTLEAVIRYVEDVASPSFKDLAVLAEHLLKMADEAKLKSFVKEYLLPHLNKSTNKTDLEHFMSTLKLLLDSAMKIYPYIKLLVHFIIPLNQEVLPMEAIARGVLGGGLDVVKVASGTSQALIKVTPQVLRGLGYAEGGVAIVVDLGFLIHTCVTMDDVPHVEKLRSLADQMEEMDLESVQYLRNGLCISFFLDNLLFLNFTVG